MVHASYKDQTTALAALRHPGRAVARTITEMPDGAPREMDLRELGLGNRPTIDLSGSYPGRAKLKLPPVTPDEETDFAVEVARGISHDQLSASLQRLFFMGVLNRSTVYELTQIVSEEGSFAGALERLRENRESEKHPPDTAWHRRTNAANLRDLTAVALNFVPDDRSFASLRERIAGSLFCERDIPLERERGCPNEMVICRGSSMGIHLAAFAAIAEPGDTILVPQGVYESITVLAESQDRRVVIVPTAETGMLVTADAIEDAISARKNGNVRGMVLVNPSGIFGNYHAKSELQKIARVAERHDLTVVCDELYAGLGELAPGGAPFHSFASIRLEEGGASMHSRTVTIQGTSAVCPFLDIKLGIAVGGNTELMSKIRENVESVGGLPNAASLFAVSKVWTHIDAVREAQARLYAGQISVLRSSIDGAAERSGIRTFSLLVPPQTGYFAGLSVSAEMLSRSGVSTSRELAEYLLGIAGIETRPVSGMFAGETNGKITVRLNTSALDRVVAADLLERMTGVSQALIRENPPTMSDARRAIYHSGGLARGAY